MFRTRGSALLAGVVAAFFAAILLIVYLNSYRSSVNSGKRPEPVLIAKRLIPAGTSGELVATTSLYQATTVPKDQLKTNAVTDPGTLSGMIAAHDIFPGAQLTTGDFTTTDASALQYKLSGRQRAISVPVDITHGLIGQLVSGATVDVYVAVAGAPPTATQAGGTLLRLLAPDILVLVAPGSTPGGLGANTSGSNAVLRVTTDQAARFAYAAENEKLWLILRPQVGASKTPPSVATLSSLLVGRG